ncbi:DUF6406 domain-containing protein [Streptomyces filipinensis]|uniref:DUF6406 domain-containing protein n=1 Tax=Streptomyces filipinensis TaxID=66887 RepID=UPI0036E11609
MPDISHEFTVRHGQMTNLPFGRIGAMWAIPGQEDQPAQVQLSIGLPGRESEVKILPLGATFTLENGTWTVAEIYSAGTLHWSAKLRRID